jgi:hypothetical protein
LRINAQCLALKGRNEKNNRFQANRSFFLQKLAPKIRLFMIEADFFSHLLLSGVQANPAG